MKSFITLTGIDATRLMVDSDKIVLAQEVQETSDHGYTQMIIDARDNKGHVVIKVNEPIDIIIDKVQTCKYEMYGSKL